MLTAQAINEQISESVKSQIKVYPCNNLRASNIGHPCERYLYLLIKHWDEVEAHDENLQNIFNLGNAIEDYTINVLKNAGFEIITPVDRSWKVENPFLTGREDCRIKDTDGNLIPVEIKGLSPFEWERLNSVEDFYNSKRHYVRSYPAQLMIYLWKFEKEYGFFALTNKLTGRVKLVQIPFDWDYVDALFKKAERIYEALADTTGKTIPPACDDIDVCEECKLAHRCSAGINRPPADIDSGELQELIDRKLELAPMYKEYNEVNDQIKKFMANRDKVVCERYLVTVSTIQKKEYVVAARTERRVNIKKL